MMGEPRAETQQRATGSQFASPGAPVLRGHSILKWFDLPEFALLTLLRTLAIAWAAWSLLVPPHGPWWPLIAAAAIPLMAPALFDQLAWLSMLRAREPQPVAPRSWKTAVVTTFVPGFESLAMLERSLRAMTAIEYPHDTWLLDEGDDASARELCRALGVRHFTRRHRADMNAAVGTPFEAGSKHGNYNAWLQEIGFHEYEVLAAFDPDHVPCPSYLDETLGYLENPEVGYIQVAQAYYNQSASFIARGAAEETYAYQALVQPAAAQSGYVVVNGSHNIHRIPALRQVGGFAAHAADDLLITLRYGESGWKGVYVPRVLAQGLAPVDWATYVRQQWRWARAVLELKLRRPAAAQRSGTGARILSWLQGVGYVLDAAFGLTVLAILVLLLVTRETSTFAPVLGTILLLYALLACSNQYKKQFYLNPETRSGFPWRSYVLRTVKWPFTVAALFQALRARPEPYTITPKLAQPQRTGSVMAPQYTLAAIIFAAFVAGSYGNGESWTFTATALAAAALPLGAAFTERLRVPPGFDARFDATVPSERERRTAAGRLIPLTLMAFAAWWSLLGAFTGTVSYVDSTRHVMNGAFLLDLVRGGGIEQPMQFASKYYAHFPAVSIPYHPPLFPAFEAVIFGMAGVSYPGARIALAITVALAIVLLYRLLVQTLPSRAVAALVCVCVLGFNTSQWLAREVMLEFPALVFLVSATAVLYRSRQRFTAHHGLMFGLLASAGVWTKQTLVFLALVPPAFLIMSGRGAFLKLAGIWVAAGAIAVSSSVLAAAFAAVSGSLYPGNWTPVTVWGAIAHNLPYYLPQWAAIAAALTVAFMLRRRFRHMSSRRDAVALHSAWLLAASAIVLISPAYEARYLFAALPPAVALVYLGAYSGLAARTSPRRAVAVLAIGTAVILLLSGIKPIPLLSGPEKAAELLVRSGEHRTLYFGSMAGAFIFAAREADPSLRAVVLRGDRLPDVSPNGVERFAREYGVDHIVIEVHPLSVWRYLTEYPPPSMQLAGTLPMVSSAHGLNGLLLLYRFTAKNPEPKTTIRQRIEILGAEREVAF